MTTQIVFKIDEKLKKSVQKRAKREGITLSDFFKSAAKSFAGGEVNIGLVRAEERRRWEEADTDRAIAVYLREKKQGKLKRLKSLADLD